MHPSLKEGDKLYLITRNDLSPGYQAVQSCHAIRQFVEEHPDIDSAWFKESNYIALLQVENEEQLESLLLKASTRGIKCTYFREPDLSNELTAIALEPAAKNLCKRLPLALK